jgi:hypothetical protein
VRRGELLRLIGRAAKRRKLTWRKEREGKRHEIWLCGSTAFPVPRHKEINNFTAEAIMKDLENELGKDWWRK